MVRRIVFRPSRPWGAGGVIDHVGGHEVVQDRFVGSPLPSEQLLHHVSCAAPVGRGHQLCPGSRSDRVMPSGCPCGH
jgi:hypothetical protein